MNARTLLAAALATALLAACGKAQEAASEAAAEKAIEASTGQKVDIDNKDGQQTVTMETEQGQLVASAGENVALPAGFPEDVHLPADATLLSAMSVGPTMIVALKSKQAMATTFESFRKSQADDGWKETMSMQSGDGGVLSFEKEGKQVMARIAKDAEGSTVSVTVQPKQ
jgi:major membrane immunogen (membrane-anchored lipoprotein)